MSWCWDKAEGQGKGWGVEGGRLMSTGIPLRGYLGTFLATLLTLALSLTLALVLVPNLPRAPS